MSVFCSTSCDVIHQVYRRFLSAFGPRHADTADILYNIGLLHKDLLDFETADKYLRSALDIYVKVNAALYAFSLRISLMRVQLHGPRHRDVGFTWHDVGDVALKAEKLHQAVAAFELAYSIRAEALGEEDEDTQSSKSALCEARAAMLKTS
jgi:tetratricopeptide (TPR) repeat protein